MKKFKIIFDDEEQDEVFDSYEDAEEFANYLCGCWHEGGETLQLSNPGDYPYDPDDEPDYDIIEVEE